MTLSPRPQTNKWPANLFNYTAWFAPSYALSNWQRFAFLRNDKPLHSWFSSVCGTKRDAHWKWICTKRLRHIFPVHRIGWHATLAFECPDLLRRHEDRDQSKWPTSSSASLAPRGHFRMTALCNCHLVTFKRPLSLCSSLLITVELKQSQLRMSPKSCTKRVLATHADTTCKLLLTDKLEYHGQLIGASERKSD